MHRWITWSDLCRRWNIVKQDLAYLVYDGKITGYNADDSTELCIHDDDCMLDSRDDETTLIHKENFSMSDVTQLIFSIRQVEEYEKKHIITPHIAPSHGYYHVTPEPTEKEDPEFSAAFDEAEKRSPIIDDIRWLESQKPRDINEMINKDKLLNDRRAKLAKIGGDQTEDDSEKVVDPTEAAKPLSQNPSPVNFFILEGGFWQVGYEGEKKTVRNLDGMRYITLLIEKRGESISCSDLYQTLYVKTPDRIMAEGEAIEEGINIGSSKQAIIDSTAEAEYIRKYMELENDLLRINDLPDNERTPEDDMEKKEIEKEMVQINRHLKEKTFTDPNDKKAQSNISKRLDDAYNALDRAGMKSLVKHLQVHIKPDGRYGLFYSGSITWDIIQ